MEIVPIIYIALIVVVTLTILTLIFSFASNKRKETKPITSAENVPFPLKEFHKEQIFEKKVVVPLPKQKIEIKQKKVEKVDLLKVNVDGKEKKSATKKEIQKGFKPSKRVKILNSSKLNPAKAKTQNLDSFEIKKSQDKLNSLGNEIIEKYTDDNQSDMFTLKVNEIKNKSKNKS